MTSTTSKVLANLSNRVASTQQLLGVSAVRTPAIAAAKSTKCYLSTSGKGLRRTKFGPRVHHITRTTTTSNNTTTNKPIEQKNATSRDNSLFESPEVIVVDTSTKIKNAVMALSLLGFCAGVVVYSMNSVGQAGTSSETGDDPLAVLKEEAAAAQRQHDKNEAEEKKSAAMIQQFQAGEYDPDKLPDDEDDDLATPAPKKKSWWKFWARS
jgi:hypothetical protein